MFQITINDLEFCDSHIYTSSSLKNVSIIGGKGKKDPEKEKKERPPVDERWWFKPLVSIGTAVGTAVVTGLLADC